MHSPKVVTELPVLWLLLVAGGSAGSPPNAVPLPEESPTATSGQSSAGPGEKPSDRKVAHDVYFALKDNSDAAKAKLVAACKKYLAKHPGVVWFAVGTRAKEFNRPVNDQEFDVSLHVGFASKDAHDKYQKHAHHEKFIEENKDNWKGVKVFDSYVEP